jgi:hypothetical protein
MSTTWVGDGWASSTLHDAVVKYESAATNNIGDFTKFTFPLIRPKTAEQLRLFSHSKEQTHAVASLDRTVRQLLVYL